MIIYLIDPKTGQDNNKNPVEVPDNILRRFGASIEHMEYNGISYYRSINYSIESPYGWGIINDSNQAIRNQT